MRSVMFEGTPHTPSKVVCVGRNYVKHIEELGNEMPESMVLFNKPNSAITDRLDAFGPGYRFEGEICFIVQSGEAVGVGFGLDLTYAKKQEYLKAKGLPWERAKAFDGSAVLSPFVPLRRDDIPHLRMKLLRDGAPVQEGGYDLMIYKPQAIIQEIKSFMTLEDGDIIMSGTPKGVDSFGPGERFCGRVYAGETLLVENHWKVKERR